MSLPKDIANIGSIANAVYNSITANTTAITSISAAVMDINTGTAIASAATINLNTATGNRVHITGTTTITAVTLTRGPRTVIFDDVLTLTHHATTNNLPGAANITTAAGDRAIYESDGTTVYCVSYIKVSGASVVAAAASAMILISTIVASTSATVNFTGLSSTFQTYLLVFTSALPDSSSQFRLRLSSDNNSTFLPVKISWYNPSNASYFTGTEDYMNLHNTAIQTTASEGGISGHIYLYNPSSITSGKLVTGQTIQKAAASFPYGNFPSAAYVTSATAINSFRLLFASGNIVSGTFKLYGIT